MEDFGLLSYLLIASRWLPLLLNTGVNGAFVAVAWMGRERSGARGWQLLLIAAAIRFIGVLPGAYSVYLMTHRPVSEIATGLTVVNVISSVMGSLATGFFLAGLYFLLPAQTAQGRGRR